MAEVAVRGTDSVADHFGARAQIRLACPLLGHLLQVPVLP